jgi:mono/diheme cytochrome c family protein
MKMKNGSGCWVLGSGFVAAALVAAMQLPVVEAQAPAPSFAATVYPVLEKANCRACHTDEGVASGTRLHFPSETASAEEIDAFGLTLVVLVNRDEPSSSLLLNKPTNRIRHVGGVKIAPDSADEQVVRTWVQHLVTVPDSAVSAARARLAVVTPGAAHQVGLRRLTHSQYNNTVRDLLGDYSRPADRFPPEDFVSGFKNQTRTQSIPPVLEDAYSTAAERIALNAFRAGDVNNLIPCKPASTRDLKCRDQFVRAFGEKAFRRPLTDVEIRRYNDLFAEQANRTGKFLEGARVVVEAMLQSPKFLFHVTAGDPSVRLKPDTTETGSGGTRSVRLQADQADQRDYAIADRLSYLLWDTMPDRALLDAASKGELRTPEGLERVARTMLEDPRARQATDEFFSQWLRFDRMLTAAKDDGRYPSFTPELAAMMVQETRMLLGHLVWNDRNFMEAFTADYSFLNADLARVYGLPEPAGEFEIVKFPEALPRAGILGQSTFLASTTGPVETSPTARGLFVREHLLCQIVPNPPPGVNTNLPEPATADAARAKRERMVEHAQNPTCSGCHRLMDPIGFGLEKYDAIGAWRDQEIVDIFRGAGESRRSKPANVDITATGEIAGIANSTFGDARALGRVLASSPVCQDCVVKQMFRYAFGRAETPSDRSTVMGTAAVFRSSGFKFKELLISLVRSPQFVEGL